MPSYGLPSYWEERYTRTECKRAEWYLPAEAVLAAAPTVPGMVEAAEAAGRSASALILGVGTSSLPSCLVGAGFGHVSCVDVSTALISWLEEEHAEDPRIAPIAADACALSEADLPGMGQFDLVVDKALTDAARCSEHGDAALTMVAKGAHAALRPGGAFLLVSQLLPGAVQSSLLSPGSKPAKWQLCSSAAHSTSSAMEKSVVYVHTLRKAPAVRTASLASYLASSAASASGGSSVGSGLRMLTPSGAAK